MVRYLLGIVAGSKPEKSELFVSLLDNSEETNSSWQVLHFLIFYGHYATYLIGPIDVGLSYCSLQYKFWIAEK
jgi:hypothetical protein